MKKLVLCMSIAAAILSSTAAFAAEYDTESNTYTGVDGSSYRTVLISKDGSTSDNDIVYVGQTDGDSTFGASVNFMLKENPAAGDYTVSLGGGDSGEVATLSFTISEIPVVTPTEVEAEQAFTEAGSTDDYTNVAFGWEGVSATEAQTVILQLGDKAYGWEFPTTITGGEVNIGIKIKDVPVAQYNENAKAYLSSKTLEEIKKPTASEENTVVIED